MVLCSVGLLLSLLYSSVLVSTEEFKSLIDNSSYVTDPDAEWLQLKHILADDVKASAQLPSKRSGSSPRSSSGRPRGSAPRPTPPASLLAIRGTAPPDPTTNPGVAAQELPEFVRVRASKSKELKRILKPEAGPARMLPAPVKQMLHVTVPPTPPPAPTRPQPLEALCHIDRMYVRVRRDLFSTFSAYKNLKMGSCPVNQATNDHYFLLYLLTSDCGFHKESSEDAFIYSVNVHYSPNTENGVVRELSFSVPIRCRYHRFHHSFRAGYRSKLPEPAYRQLNSKQSTAISITVKDESGNNANVFTMGKPMCFEAELTSPKPGDRVYINECFVTKTPDAKSTPQYTVIANRGCMTDGMLSEQSKFKLLENTPRTRQMFCIAAFRFEDTLSTPSQLMYLHCDISVGKLEASETAKTCNFDLRYQRWRELYGKHAACACCPDSCGSVRPRASKKHMVSSQPWKVEEVGSKMPAKMEGEPAYYGDLNDVDDDFMDPWKNK